MTAVSTQLMRVIDHYNFMLSKSSTTNILLQNNIKGLNLTTQEKSDLKAFFKTLSDNTYLNNPEYKSPF